MFIYGAAAEGFEAAVAYYRDGLEVSCLTGGLTGLELLVVDILQETGAAGWERVSRGLEQLVGRGSTGDWNSWLVQDLSTWDWGSRLVPGLPGTGAAGW